MLIPYESFFIQAHHQHEQLIAEQNPGERNPLLQLGIKTTDTRHNLNNNTRHDTLASSHSESTKGGLRKRYVHYYTHSILKKF
jgi:hypothetical protein